MLFFDNQTTDQNGKFEQNQQAFQHSTLIQLSLYHVSELHNLIDLTSRITESFSPSVDQLQQFQTDSNLWTGVH